MHSSDRAPGAVDVRVIMREVRQRARGNTREHDWARAARRAIPSHAVSSIARLQASAASMRAAAWRIGEVPPAPPTLRGRLGSVAVKVMHRALFWVFPAIRSSQLQLVDAMESHLKASEETLEALRKTNYELAKLQDQVSALRAASGNGKE